MVVYPQIRTSADLLNSTIRLQELIPFLQEQQAAACAVVNSTLYNMLPFWHAMKKANIQPIIGLYVNVMFSEHQQLPLILYAKNNEGYQNLLKISSAISIRDDKVLPIRWLQGYAKGCLAVIPIMAEEAKWLVEDHFPYMEQLKETFHADFHIGISRQPQFLQEEQLAIQWSEKLSAKIIALHESVFIDKKDYFAYKVARAIELGIKVADLPPLQKKEYYLLTREDWELLFTDQPHWLENAQEVLLSCHVTLSQTALYMPKFPLSPNETAEQLLQQHVYKGLCNRLQVNMLPPQYEERLTHELSIICSMGYADYFLIVEDFMTFARNKGILTGPGRGSSASSLVAYALFITDVDPLQYDLLFERFLNPERITLPDIDIDFVDTKRHEVIEYVAKKYGQQHVAQIITFGTLSAKAVARDVARVLGFEQAFIEQIAKMIPNKQGITLQQAYDDSENLQKWINSDDDKERWFTVAKKLEGLPRNRSTHAAGVILSPVPLVEVVPIEKGHDDIYMTQWTMQEVEHSGLLKMDFLGLRNLTILQQIQRSIRYSLNKEIILNDIPLQDEQTFALLQAGNTTGIFQLESAGMREALREICPTTFLDIVAVNALYRPGPMDFITTYAKRKHGKERVEFLHPTLKPILQETYGVLIYQEQIMRIASTVANFTIGQADVLRRAISKKNRQVIAEQQHRFIEGAMTNGYDKQVAEQIYALIERFADYGFPKSHAVAYSLISYYMAYLKANYPVHFYAALLTNATGNKEKITELIYEAKANGIVILPPSITKSERFFTIESGKIRYSLSAIKGVSQVFLKNLMTTRKNTPFQDLFEFAAAIPKVDLQEKTLAPLVKAGALDEFGIDRAVLMSGVEAIKKHMEFGVGKLKLPNDATMTTQEKLQYEKEVLGFYLSEHPLEKWRKEIEVNSTTRELNEQRVNSYVKMLAIVEDVKQIRTKKGELMAFVQLQDEFGHISATLFPKEYEALQEKLQPNYLAYVEGVFELRFGKGQIKVKTMHLHPL